MTDETFRLISRNREALKKDIKLLEDIKARSENIANEYNNIARNQRKVSTILSDNLKIIEKAADIIGKNIGNIDSKDITKLIKQIDGNIGGIVENIFSTANSRTGDFVPDNKSTTSFNKSTNRILAEITRAMQKAGRNL